MILGGDRIDRPPLHHGVVVDSVNVSVLPYAPVRSPSVAAIDCLKSIVTGVCPTGSPNCSSASGEPLIGANAPVPARASSG